MKAADVSVLGTLLLDLLPHDLANEKFADAIQHARRQLPYDDLISYLRSRPGFRPGPDLVLLGLPRTGTSWLFWHFYRSASVAKIPFKELNFLNFKTLFSNSYYASPAGFRNWRVYRNLFMTQANSWVDAGFTDMTAWAIAHLIGRRDWRWYDTILGASEKGIGVDYSPLNFKMSEMTARTLRLLKPATRYAIIVRHPLEQHQSYLSRLGNKDFRLLHHLQEFSSESGESIRPFLFGERTRRLSRLLGNIEIFYFSDLKRDPIAFMLDFCARLGVTIERANMMTGSINAMEAMPKVRYTREAIALLLADVAQLGGFIEKTHLDRWINDIEKLSSESKRTGYAEIAGY